MDAGRVLDPQTNYRSIFRLPVRDGFDWCIIDLLINTLFSADVPTQTLLSEILILLLSKHIKYRLDVG